MEESRNPDLRRILAGLSGSIPGPPTPSSHDLTTPNVANAGLALPPSNLHLPSPITKSTLLRTLPLKQAESLMVSKVTVPDPSTIISYPGALKHITKHIITNEVAATRIKNLIAQQAKHEREWWASREALIQRQLGRADRQLEVAALLKSLGGLAAPIVVDSDPAVNKRELEAYDRKVYAEMTKMSVEFDRQLRGLGVPFFVIKHSLVVMDGKVGQSAEGQIDKGELRELQRKVLQALEDLLVD